MRKTPSQQVVELNNLSDNHANELQQSVTKFLLVQWTLKAKPTAKEITFLWNLAPILHSEAHMGNLGEALHFRMQSRVKFPVSGVAVFATLTCFCDTILHFISERQG